MKICFLIRHDYLTSFGGDSKVLLSIADFLENAGINYVINPENEFSKDYVYHIFNIQSPNIFLKYLDKIPQGSPVIFSVTFWDSRFENGYLLPYFKAFVKELLSVSPLKSTYSKIKNSLQKIDTFVFNSFAEAEGFFYAYCCHFIRKNSTIIHQFVSEKNFYVKKDFYSRKYDIITVGRIESAKRQNELIDLLKGTNIKILFIGKARNDQYSSRFLSEVSNNPNITHLDFVANEDLIDYYNDSKIGVLLSKRESPGLVNIEAALCGCNLILSTNGPIKEYFGEFAYYFDGSISDNLEFRNLIEKLIKNKPEDKLKDYLLSNCSEKNLKRYLELYQYYYAQKS